MSDLTRQQRALRRIGHKGADHIAPGNTTASFDAAIAHGCDMLEFDVLPERAPGGGLTGRLVLAHDYKAAERGRSLTLEEGLDHLCTPAFDGIDLDVDLKTTGYEERVVAALRERGMEQRTLISTMEVSSFPVIRALSDTIRLGWSVPKVKHNYLAHPATKGVAMAMLAVLRRTIPRTMARAIRAGEVDAVMSHYALVTPYFVRTVRGAGGELYVWTVDDADHIRRFEQMGVTGIITNDPRLFGPLDPTTA
jgi:glycerophosphoryl diester phosphodiesterase